MLYSFIVLDITFFNKLELSKKIWCTLLLVLHSILGSTKSNKGHWPANLKKKKSAVSQTCQKNRSVTLIFGLMTSGVARSPLSSPPSFFFFLFFSWIIYMNSEWRPAGTSSGRVLGEKDSSGRRPQTSHSFGFSALLPDNRRTIATSKFVPLILLRMAAGDERVSCVCLGVCMQVCALLGTIWQLWVFHSWHLIFLDSHCRKKIFNQSNTSTVNVRFDSILRIK